MIKCVIFDFGDTLFDSANGLIQVRKKCILKLFEIFDKKYFLGYLEKVNY